MLIAPVVHSTSRAKKEITMSETLLITGGAGYIGSHTALLCKEHGHNVIVLDNFLHQQEFSPPWATVIRGDIRNAETLNYIFSTYPITGVIHFAALIEVGESVTQPAAFYETNVQATLQLLNTMRRHGITTFIFSSSCAVYGNPMYTPLDESHIRAPISPYGKTKLAVEYILEDYAIAYNLSFVGLRYFNAAGALPTHGLGEYHQPETHLIPRILRSFIAQTPLPIYGTDYPTPDGTALRDYVHVRDIAHAHVMALDYLRKGEKSNFFNLGSENGTSVANMISTAEEIVGKRLPTTKQHRRPGDPAILVADASQARHTLGWRPLHSDLHEIIISAWEWEQHLIRTAKAPYEKTPPCKVFMNV
jgi:UDP-glucose 4-epimerase